MINIPENNPTKFFINDIRLENILNHKGESVVGFINNYIDLKSEYPLLLDNMIKNNKLETFDRNSSKFNLFHFCFLISDFFYFFYITHLFGFAYQEFYDDENKKIKENVLETFEEGLEINFEYDVEKFKQFFYYLKDKYFFDYFDSFIFLEKDTVEKIIFIRKYIKDLLLNIDFYLDKIKEVDKYYNIKKNYKFFDENKKIHFKNSDEDIFIKQVNLDSNNYDAITVIVENNAEKEIELLVYYKIKSSDLDGLTDFNCFKEITVKIPPKTKNYSFHVLQGNKLYDYCFYIFVKRKDNKLLNNKHHINGSVQIY